MRSRLGTWGACSSKVVGGSLSRWGSVNLLGNLAIFANAMSVIQIHTTLLLLHRLEIKVQRVSPPVCYPEVLG